MIIDTSNAPCGPGFLPGLRLSEGRFAINRRPPRLRGWGRSQAPRVAFVPLRADRRDLRSRPPRLAPGALPPSLLRPPRQPGGRGGAPSPSSPPRTHESGAAAGGPRCLRAARVTRAPAGAGSPRRRRSAPAGENGGKRFGCGGAGPGPGPVPSLRGSVRLPASGRGATTALSLPPSLPLGAGGAAAAAATFRLRPQIRRDNPLNLSILLSGGKETNKDSLSSGERRGKSPAPNPRPRWAREMWRTGDGRRPGVDRGPESF